MDLRVVAEVAGATSLRVELTPTAGGTPVSFERPYAPVLVLGDADLDLGGLARGAYTLRVTALDATGAAIPDGTRSADFALGAPFATTRLQAEDATLGLTAGKTHTAPPVAIENATAAAVAASGGGYVDIANAPATPGTEGTGGGQYVEWTITVPDAGSYDLGFGYANAAGFKAMRLDVNGSLVDRIVQFASTGAATTYAETGTRVALTAGVNTIRLTANGYSGPNLDYLEVRPVTPAKIVVQAEALTLTTEGAGTLNKAVGPTTLLNGATTSDTYRIGAEGNAYLDWGTSNQNASFTFDAPGPGTYSVRVTYANGGTTPRPLDLELVGSGAPQSLGTFNFAPTNAAGQVLPRLTDDLSDLNPVVLTGGTGTSGVDDSQLSQGWEGWSVETRTITVTAAGPVTLQLASNARTTGPNLDRIEVELVSLTASAPSAVSLQNDSVLENRAGAAIGRVLVTDTDGSAHSVVVSEDGGATPSARFEVVDGILKLIAGTALDHEAGAVLTLTLTVSDANTASTLVRSVQVLVGDVNEAPGTLALALASPTVTTGILPGTVVGQLSAVDPEGNPIAFSINDARFTVDPDGTLKVANGASFVAGDLTLQVTAGDGSLSNARDFVLSVVEGSAAPTAITLTAIAVPENQAGAVVAAVAVADPDTIYLASDLVLTGPDAGLFRLVSGGPSGIQLALKDGISLDFEATRPQVTVGLAAGSLTSGSFQPSVINVAEPMRLVFNAGTITSYSTQDRPQDGGAGVVVDADGGAVTLGGNFWKRAPLPSEYVVTTATRLTVDVQVLGSAQPEMVVIGFDFDANPFDDANVYQLAGTQAVPTGIVSRLGTGVDLGNGVTRYTIDLGAHAGARLTSLVLASDDDLLSNGIASTRFSNVMLSEFVPPTANQAPRVVGGGIADLAVLNDAVLEIDLPFVDDNGQALSYTISVVDALGNAVASNLAVTNGILTGNPPLVPGAYTVTVRASDGELSASDAFVLSVTAVNRAPVSTDPSFEPFSGFAGRPFTDAIALADFDSYFSDPNGDALTLSFDPATLPPGLSINAEGALVGTPTQGGSYAVKVRATDAGGLSAELTVPIEIGAPAVGDVTVIEAERFTGLGSGSVNFVASAQVGASGNQILRAGAAGAASVTTDLTQNGLLEGHYRVAMTFFDETDGSARYTLRIGNTVLASGAFDAAGTFVNAGSPRGDAGQIGNLRTVVFNTPVEITAGSVLTLTGTANLELLRIDRFTFTRLETPAIPPSAPSLTAGPVSENASGAVIGLLSATDADGPASAIVFSTSNERFEITPSGQLKLKAGVSLDYETETSVTVAVTATDGSGRATTGNVVVSVGQVDEAPGLPVLVQASVAENAAGASIGALASADPEGTAVTFSTAANSIFEVVGGVLKLKAGQSLNFEAGATLSVAVTARDAAGLETNGNVLVSVTDVNEAPVIPAGASLAPVTFAFGAGGTIALGGLGATDPDAGQTPGYGLRGANGAAVPTGFSLVNGQVVVASAAASGTYQLEVFATDGTLQSNVVPLVVTVGAPAAFTPIVIQENAGTISLSQAVDTNSTQFRSAANPEPTAPTLRANFSGAGYLDFGNDGGDRVTWTVTVPTAGNYDLNFRFGNGGATARPLDLVVNGATPVSLSFASTDTDGAGPISGFDVWQFLTRTVALQAGTNSFSLAIPAGVVTGPNIDRIEVTRGFSGPIGTVDTTADEGANLTATAIDPTLAPAALGSVGFRLGGVDSDILTFQASLDNGETFTDVIAVPDATTPATDDWRINLDLTSFASETGANVILRVIDDAGNRAQQTASLGITQPSNSEPGPRETIRIDFQDGTVPNVPGYLVANFDGYAVRNANTGLSYGFVTEASVLDNVPGTIPINGAAFPAVAINERTGGVFDTYDRRLTGYAHLDLAAGYPDLDGNGVKDRVAFELGVANGWYEVTVAVGDTGGPNDSVYKLLVEGVLASDYIPTDLFKTELTTVVVQVTDGRLTLSAPQGTITELQYLDVRALPDLTPDDGRAAPLDYAKFINPVAIGGVGAGTTTVNLDPASGPVVGVDPTGDIILGVQLAANRNGILLESLTDGSIKLYETLTGRAVTFGANTTAGGDSLTISPTSNLKPNTSYTLVVDGLQDRGENTTSGGGATREFQKFTTTFTTGVEPVVAASPVAFTQTVDVNASFGLFTSVEMAPDGSQLYASTLGGLLKRWDVNPTTGALSNEQTLQLDHFQGASGPRGLIGLTFDPTNPKVIWVTDNDPVPLDGRNNSVPDFSGRISKVTLGDGPGFTGTAATYITGLPRSNGDHVSNSLEFRANPDAGRPGEPSYLLYLMNGSNSAMGEADSAWGFRPERLLNAAVLEIDPTRTAPAGGFNVSTEPLPQDGNNRRFGYNGAVPTDDGNLKNGGIPIDSGPFTGKFLHFNAQGVASVRDTALATSAVVPGGTFYDPFAADAVLRIFATGQRNAFDLVWHSNGFLYAPTNGSAAGGSVPDNPNTPANEKLTNLGVQNDYLFKISEGTFSGHPNALRDKFIMNGANPTAGVDPNEVSNYPIGTLPDPQYVAADAYSLGRNRSPNGAIEYKSNVFGSNLKGAIIVAEYSSGNDLRALLLDANGRVTRDFVLTDPTGRAITQVDPLDVIEGANGRLYLMTLDRATGNSLIVRLDPVVTGVADTTADEGGDLALVVVNSTNPAAVQFQVNGLDADITALTLALNGGATQTVTLDADKRFSLNLAGQPTPVSAVLQVTDDNGNTATKTASVTPGAQAPATVIDGINFTVLSTLTGTGATIARRLDTPSSHEPSPRTFDISPVDGLNDGYNGGGYLDPNGGAEDKASFAYTAAVAGTYTFEFRLANGSTSARPIAVKTGSQTATISDTRTATFTDWKTFSVTLDLVQGNNTIVVAQTAAAGSPNIDSVSIRSNQAETFVPTFASVTTETRIEREAVDNTTRTLSATTAEFFFKVGTDGTYALDFAANAGAPNGGGLTLLLNGAAVGREVWPAIGEQTAFLDLVAGTNYTLRVVSDSAGANALDYLDVRAVPLSATADIGIQSLDPAFFDNRLHFSFLENPTYTGENAALPPRESKVTGVVRISNTGSTPLQVLDWSLDGPFTLANAAQLNGLTLAAGAFRDITVQFNRAAYTPPTTNVNGTSTVFTGTLNLRTNDADSPLAKVDLAGFWQLAPEAGQEPNVNEMWRIFGFGNVIENLSLLGGGENSTLSTHDVFGKTDETEILSPYWRLADGVTTAKITHISAYHGPGGAALQLHNPGNKNDNITIAFHAGNDNQTILPNNSDNVSFAAQNFTRTTIPDLWAGADFFGISLAGQSTDPRLNPTGGVLVGTNGVLYTKLTDTTARTPGGQTVQISSLELVQQGHTVKLFQALDANGVAIPNVYLGLMDYTGINYDYNDNSFIIEGVTPVGFGGTFALSGLDTATADARLVFTNIELPADAQQQFRKEAVLTLTNDGSAAVRILSSAITGADPTAFELVGMPTSIAAGATVQVTVRFIGRDLVDDDLATLLKAALEITTDAFGSTRQVIQLAGLAQNRSELGEEPTVAQIVQAFGYTTNVAQGQLANGGLVQAVGDEVLMPYLERLDPTKLVEVIQLGAYLQQGNVARLGFHGVGSASTTNLFANDDQQGQTVLPDGLVAGIGDTGSVARGTITTSLPFGLHITVDGRPTFASWSDPEANEIDPQFGQLVDDGRGHLIRYFQAKDANGQAIAGTYIGLQDYPGGGNFDYNDHVFLIRNVKPHALTTAEDANGDGINDALRRDADNDGVVDFFDTPGVNKGAYVVGFNIGGAAVASQDGLGGVTLRADNDALIRYTGDAATRPIGTDAANNLNGANALPGAFKTYRDGKNWTVEVSGLKDGAYIVGLHTQETYWNAAGKRVFDMSINGTLVANDLDPFVRAGGGDKPVTIEALVQVTGGRFTVLMDGLAPDGIDNAPLNAITVHAAPANPNGGLLQTAFPGPTPIFTAGGLTVDASNYDTGGLGIAYNDALGLQGTGTSSGGRAGSDVEQTAATNGDITGVAAGDWLEYTINVAAAGSYDVDLLLSGTGAGRAAKVDFFLPDAASAYATTGSIANGATGSFANFATRGVDGVALQAGTQVVRVTFEGGDQNFRSFSITQSAAPPSGQSPFPGPTAPSVGTVATTFDASNYDNGGQGLAYNDTIGLQGAGTTNGGRAGSDVEQTVAGDITSTAAGEWLEYSVNISSAGAYDLDLLLAAAGAGKAVKVDFYKAGAVTPYITTGTIANAATTNLATFAARGVDGLLLDAGEQVMRVNFLADQQDFRSFTLTKVAPAQTPFPGPIAPAFAAGSLRVDATNYDNGGQGIAFNDTTAGLAAGATNGGRSDNRVDHTAAGDIGFTATGEWLEYTINVGQTGSHDLRIELATDQASRQVRVDFFKPGETVAYETTGSILNPSTGSYTNFLAREALNLDLDAGQQVARVTFINGVQDFRAFTLTQDFV